jgi:hypothetical protein
MIDQDSEPTGDLEAEVLQEDPDTVALAPVAVNVAGPVAVQHVPSRSGASFNRKIVLTEDVRVLLSADPRRRVATVIADQIMSIGSDQQSVAAGVAAIWPANVPCPITHADEVWVDLAADGVVSVMVENWAD